MEVLKALQMLATADLKTDNEAERTAKVKSLRVVDEQLTQPMLRTTNEFDKLLEFGVFALLRMLQDTDMNVWSLAEQVLIKTVKVLESTHRDKIVTEVWKGVKGSKVEGRSRRFAIELFALYSHRIKPSKADKFREALLRNLVSIARQEDDQLLQEALSKCIDPIITHQLAHAPLADLDPFLDELAANVRSTQARVRRSAVTCIVSLCRGHKQHLDLFVASVRRLLNLVLINATRDNNDPTSTANTSASADTKTVSSNEQSGKLIDLPEEDDETNPSSSNKDSNVNSDAPDSASVTIQQAAPDAILPEIPLTKDFLRKPISDLDIADKLIPAVAASSSATLQGVLHGFRQLLRLNIEFISNDLYAMPNPMNADMGTFARIATQALGHKDTNVTVAALELLQEIFENNWQPLAQLGGTGFKAKPEKDEITAYVEHIVALFESMLFDQSLRISVQVLVVACFCALSVPLPLPVQLCLKRRLPQFMELLKHSDPLLRGQAYYFVGCFTCGWLQTRHRIDWPELDIFELLGTILHSTMQDDSAIPAKMACEGLSICTEPLLASEYAFFVPYMLQHLMCLPSDAYLLLKSKTFSLMSKIDYRMISYMEKSMKKLKASEAKPGAASSSSSVVRLPVHLTIGNQKIQNSVVDFLISFLQDQDPRVRHKAGSVLVKLVPHLNYSHFFDTAERRQYVVALRILDMQTSQHMSEERNNDWKEHTDWLLWKLVPKINQAVESLFLKGFYHFLRVLLEKGYNLPGQLVGIMLDQLACSNLATDLDTQLDVAIMMSHLVKHLTGSLASYTQRIFVHILRILHILSAVLSNKSIPSFKETKPGTEKDLPAGAVQGQPQYLQLWEKLQDTYRLSLTSLHGNLFDEFCVTSIKSLTLIAQAMGKGVVPYIEEVLGYVNDHFERNTEEVLECIQALLEASLSEVDLVQERATSTVLEPLPKVDDPSAFDQHVHNIVDLTTPTYDSLLNPVVPSQRKANASSLTRSRSPPSSAPNSPHVDSHAHSSSSSSSSAANASPQGSGSSAIKDQRRKMLKIFESTLKRCIEHYLCTQAVHRRRTILQLLTHIIATMRLVFDYRSLDKEASFIRQVHGHLMRTSMLHNEITRSKTAGMPPPFSTANVSTPTGTPQRPGTPVGGMSPLAHSSDAAGGMLAAASLEGTALQLSEIAATQLAFLYEMLFHCGISWNGADLMTLIPLAFTSSWQPGANQAAFEDIANILFTEHLLKQWRECPRHHSLGKPTRASAPAPGTPKSSASNAGVPNNLPNNAGLKDEWINEAILGTMRNQFVTQLLMLLPDPRAINLLAQVLDLLQGFNNSAPYFEISSVIHDGLITILLDEGTTVLFAKSSIRDLLAMFALIDHLPQETLNLNAIAATFVSISKFSLHLLDSCEPDSVSRSSTPTPSTPTKTPPPAAPGLLIDEDVDSVDNQEGASSSSSVASVASASAGSGSFSAAFDSLAPASAIPKTLKHQFSASSPNRRETSRLGGTPISRPLTPADLGIVSPLPISPAHKEETLRERSKRRVLEHERQYYAGHDRAWLPRCAFLLRILSRFSEPQILDSLSNPMKSEFAETQLLPSDVDLSSQEGIATAFSMLLTALLQRGTSALAKGVPAEYYEDWTRQVCVLTHQITYIVDSPARKAHPSSTQASSASSKSDTSSNLPLSGFSATTTSSSGRSSAPSTIGIFDYYEDSSEVDLFNPKAPKKTSFLPDAMTSVISSIDATNMLYGAVQSKFSAVAFQLCKLFQTLHMAPALQALLRFTTPTATKSAKVGASVAGDASVGQQSSASISKSGSASSFASSQSASALNSSTIANASNSGVSTSSSNLPASLPWTWFREVLHMASFSAFCRVTCSSATKAELSARREVIANLLANSDHLERITHQAHNADIKRLFTIYAISPEQQDIIISFIVSKMERNKIKETLEPHNLHQLLALTTYLPPSEKMLTLLIDHFLSSTYLSVVIATEQYFINLMTRLESTIGSEALESLVKKMLSSHQASLRVTFRKKLAKAGWLIFNANESETNPSDIFGAPATSPMDASSLAPTILSPTMPSSSASTSNQTASTTSTPNTGIFSNAISADPFSATPIASNTSNNNQVAPTSSELLQPRKTESPKALIEELVLEHMETCKYSSSDYVDLLCASMVSSSLFRRVLSLRGSQPIYLAQCLAHPQRSNVKEDILLAIASALQSWFDRHSISTSPDLNDMLVKTEDQTNIGRRAMPQRNPRDSSQSQQEPQLPSYPEIEEAPLTHLYSEDWRANVELLRLVVSAIEHFGDLPVLSPNASASDSDKEETYSSDESKSLSKGENSSSSQTKSEEEGKEEKTKNEISAATASIDLLSMTPPSISHATSDLIGMDSKDVLPKKKEESESSKIRKAFGPASLVALVSSSLRKLLILHETKTSVLSSFDITAVLSVAKHLFQRYHFSVQDLKTHPRLRRLIFRLYSCYFILFKPSKKLVLDYTSSAQVPKVLDFFYDVIRTLATRAPEGDVLSWNQEQQLYYEALQQLLQSSPSLEYETYPLQEEPINFDTHNEPVHLLSQFSQLINNMHFNYASTFTAVWKQLMEGMDEEIPSVATSEAIKVVTIRSMTSMILRAGYKASRVTYTSKPSSAGAKGFNLGIPLLSLENLRNNNLNSRNNNAQNSNSSQSIQTGSPKFLGLDISNMLTVFINSVLKPLIESYVKSTTNEPAVGKECLKSLTLLSDHFSISQWQWLHEYSFSILDSQTNIWDEDPLMRNYLLVSAAKSTAVLWPTIQPSSPSQVAPPAQLHPIAIKLQKLFNFHLTNLKLREPEIHSEDRTIMPIAKNLLLIALHYIIQARTIFDVRADAAIWGWIEISAKSAISSPDSPASSVSASQSASSAGVSSLSQGLSDKSINTTALVRFLAKTCESLVPSSRDADGRDRAQVMISQQQINQNEDDFDMAHMEEVKTLFSTVRKNSSSSKVPTQLYADDLVRSVIPHKMMQYFSAETIVSNLLAELSKPEAGAQSVAFVLHQVILRLQATLADNLDDIVTKWVLMTLPHFTINSPQRMAQAHWSLTSIFLSCSPNPVLKALFHDLTTTSNNAIDPRLFVLAGIDFYANRNLSPENKIEFATAFNVPTIPLFYSLYLQLQIMDQLQDFKQAQHASKGGSPLFEDGADDYLFNPRQQHSSSGTQVGNLLD